MKLIRYTLGFSLLLTLCLGACHPKPGGGSGNTTPPDTTGQLPTGGIKPLPVLSPAEVQAKLVANYEHGEVEQCIYKGEVVYRCSRNAPDAGTEVYNGNGDRIGRCYYNTNIVDPVCKETTNCQTLYRIANNIWGKPGVPYKKPD